MKRFELTQEQEDRVCYILMALFYSVVIATFVVLGNGQ
jgi:hypothetical protein